MNLTNTTGCPISNPYAAVQIGTPGVLLLQDHYLIDHLAHFDRERIPERAEHAQGHGAFGEFISSGNFMGDICSASFLSDLGKKTRLLCRFSTTSGEIGSSDSARDLRGFSLKLYTEEGNLDWVFNNFPVFFIRNPAKFPSLAHSQRRNPQTHLKDPTMFWDFMAQNPETLHQCMMLFTDRGTPKSSRFINGFSGHTFKWVGANGQFHYVKIHLISDQGVKNVSDEGSKKRDPDYAAKDLFESIANGEFPSWTCYVQTMTQSEAKDLNFSVLDVTKTWPKSKFPLKEFGRIVLNQNASNHFEEIEQAAFSPGNLVPGWQSSADPVLQARLFSYADAQRYRLGTNYHQLKVNQCPFAFSPFSRDGKMSLSNYGNFPNYPTPMAPIRYTHPPPTIEERYGSKAVAFDWSDDYDYSQCTEFWGILKASNQDKSLVQNIINHAAKADLRVHKMVVNYFRRASSELAVRLQQGLMEKQRL